MMPQAPLPELDRNGGLLRGLLDAMPGAVSLVDEDGTVVHANPAAERMFGHDPGELTGRPVATLHVESEDRAAVDEALRRSGSWDGDRLGRRRDGATFAARLRVRSIEADGRRLSLHFHEKAEGSGPDRFHGLTGDLFAVVGDDGYARFANPAWTRLLGYDAAELMARPLADFIHPEDRDTSLGLVERVRAGQLVQTPHCRNRFVGRDGRARWIDWTGVVDGDLLHTVGRDVTHDRQREEVLQRAQRMEALGQLTGGIAHDFNNLLQAVQGSFALIARRPDDAGRVTLLAAQGLEAARRGGALTSHLLAFSRGQAVETRPVAVAALLGGMKELLQRSLGPMTRLVLDLPEADLTARADATQLEMAVLNLVINARDAMPEGGTVTVRARPEAVTGDAELLAGAYVVLEVADVGPGMPPEIAEQAFEPFFTTKGVGKGTGLGLSQVHAMARQAAGSARIESRPGQGTVVRIWLPLVEPEAALPQKDVAAAARPALRPLRVLVIDDDEDVRRWLAAALRIQGHEVREAGDGPAGLLALDEGTGAAPDIAIVDFAMPGMNGLEVAEALAARRPGLPMILTTGLADAAALPHDLPPGRSLLRKPFGLEELEAALAAAAA